MRNFCSSKGMEAGRAVSMLSSSPSFTAQLAPPSSSTSTSSSASSSSCSSAGSPAIASLCSFPSHTSFVAKNSGHCSGHQPGDHHHLFPVMASSESTVIPSSDEPTTSAQTAPASAIDFLMLCQRLKTRIGTNLLVLQTTKRAGWVNHGLKETESIADHMHRMAVMAIIAADVPGVNRDKCVKMAVVHDIAEAIVGDITPSDGIPKEEKSRRERAAIDEMCNLLGGGLAAEEVKDLWLEYENNASLEASLVKDFDKVEMILQALEYETTQGKVLNDFYESTAGKFQTELGKAWAAEIIRRRKKKRVDP